jgi:hypothetical protein
MIELTTWAHLLLRAPSTRRCSWEQLVTMLTRPPVWRCSVHGCAEPCVRRVRACLTREAPWITVHLCEAHNEGWDARVIEAGGKACQHPSRKQAPLWAPTVWRGGPPAPVALTAVVLDVDDGTPIEVVTARWASWPHIVHTSYSHTPDHPRFRVVVPLDEPVPAELWPRVWRWIIEREPAQDRQISDLTRQFFVPQLPHRGWPWHAEVHDEPSHLLTLPERDLPAAPPAPPRVLPPREPTYGDREALVEARRRLREDPTARERAGLALGGVVRGNAIKGVTCPKCGRGSVWWPLAPQKSGAWHCQHKESCGAYGWIHDLLEQQQTAAA